MKAKLSEVKDSVFALFFFVKKWGAFTAFYFTKPFLVTARVKKATGELKILY